jgi:hypothetical protein
MRRSLMLVLLTAASVAACTHSPTAAPARIRPDSSWQVSAPRMSMNASPKLMTDAALASRQ